MRFKRALLLVCLVICLFAMASVCAGDTNDTAIASEDTGLELSADNEMNVDNLQTNEENPTLEVGDNDETVSVETDSEILTTDQFNYTYLREQIGSGGDKNLIKGTYTYNENDGDTIEITDSGVIDGNGAIIDMAGFNKQAFKVTASDVTIKNLTIKNVNFDDDGGAIFFNSSGTVINCNFTNNTAITGGAVYFNSSGNVSNCNFTNNKATGDDSYGGAILFGGTGNVANCNFTNNSATYGVGGAVNFKGSGNVTDCNFTNNNATNGGAVYFEGTGSVSNCNFTNNKATGDVSYGSAICMLSGNVSNCNFTNNSVTYGVGGAVYFEGTGSVINSNFISNNAGAVYFDGTGSVVNCNFTDNTANEDDDGGAVYFEGTGSVINCNFINNTATNYGGAVLFFVDGTVTNCNFINNTAITGGAVFFRSTGSVINCNFTDNTATTEDSGAVYFDVTGSVKDCNFINNTAITGGAVYFDDTGSVVNCNFTNNTAITGGAVYFNSSGNVSNCNFINNTATTKDGGAVYFDDTGSVKDCNFINNTATTEDGGAVYFKGSGNVTDCNFTNNSATYGVGGAVNFEDTGSVINCNFANNNAASAGAVDLEKAGSVVNCNFTDNAVTENNCEGGAIWMDSGNVVNCNFANNIASSRGGAIYFFRKSNVTNCNFAHNSANQGGAIFSEQWYTTADTCIFKTSSDTTNENTIIHPPILNVDNFTTAYGLGAKLTLDLKTDSGLPVTNGNISISVYFKNNDSLVRNYSCLSGEGWTVDLPLGSYYAIFNTEYAEFKPINRTIDVYILNVNVTSQSTNNRTVNITAKSNVYSEVMQGKVLFIVPNSNPIAATYAGNGIWWAVHTFDDYTVYEVNATYMGLDNVTISNATVSISRANSTLSVGNIVFAYNGVGSTAVLFTGATGVNARVVGQPNAKVSVAGNVIKVSGLNVGTYNLTVTTIADADHISISKTVKITVNKLKTSVSGVKVTAAYGVSKNLVITLKDVKGNRLAGKYVTVKLGKTTYKNKITNSKGQITIAVPKNLVPKTYTASITFDGDSNYAKSTGSVKVEVKKATPKITAKAKKFKKSAKTKKYTVTLKNNLNKPMKNTWVILKVNKKTYKVKTNKYGKATFKIKNLKKKGTYKATVTYKGNKYYKKVTKKNVKIIVK